MKTVRTLILSFILLACTQGMSLAQSHDHSSNPVMMSMKGLHDVTAGNLMKTAEMLSDDVYAYRPTDGVRTAGEILAHVANSQYYFCSAAAGKESPSTVDYEETAKTKADIVAALKGANDYCAGVYDGMNDAQGAEMRDFFGGRKMAATAILAFNSAHNYEHYGNLVTYMRMNDLVPPSSQ